MIEDRNPILPAHIEDTIRSIAQLHADHHAASTRLQRSVARLVDIVGRPQTVGVLTLIFGAWIAVNLLMLALGHTPFDPPPFPWLEAIVSLGALYITVLILATQRHDDQLAQHREQLTLELSILSEQKAAKIIELIEELRRDNPLLANRTDAEADAMAIPADPHSVLDAIKQSHALAMDEVSETLAAEPALD